MAIGERNEILRQRDAWIEVFNELERQIDLTIEDRNLPAERRLWRIREIVHKIAYETAVPDEKLTTSPKVLRYIRAGAIVIVVLPFVLLIMPFWRLVDGTTGRGRASPRNRTARRLDRSAIARAGSKKGGPAPRLCATAHRGPRTPDQAAL